MQKTHLVDTQHIKSGCNYASQVTNHNSESKSNTSGTWFVSSIRKNMIYQKPLVTLTHSLTHALLFLSHTNQDQISKNNNSLQRTPGSQKLDDTEIGFILSLHLPSNTGCHFAVIQSRPSVLCVFVQPSFLQILETERLFQTEVSSELMWLVTTEGFIKVHIKLSSPKWIT